MTVVAAASASFCGGEEASKRISEKLSYNFISEELFDKAADRYGLPKDIALAARLGYAALIRKIDRDRLQNTSIVKAALADVISDDNIVCYGIANIFLSNEISHILKVCFVADFELRVQRATKMLQVSEKEARSLIKKEDSALTEWTYDLVNHGPWDKDHYDMIIPVDNSNLDDTVKTVVEYTKNEVLKTTALSRKAVGDFSLASKVNMALARKKYDVDVSAKDGCVTIVRKKYSLRFEHQKKELTELAMGVDGVDNVEFKIGPNFKMPSSWPPVDFDMPKKALLVDDEKEFVQTLSERLQRRKIDSIIAYDGEDALQQAERDLPEVIVLDLKMPGIDGIEVLRRIKKTHPSTEVIILTGHGSERERQMALELGAFAYLEKPIDVDILASTMRDAYAKIAFGKKSRLDTNES
jgi:two-component system response regulator CpxR